MCLLRRNCPFILPQRPPEYLELFLQSLSLQKPALFYNVSSHNPPAQTCPCHSRISSRFSRVRLGSTGTPSTQDRVSAKAGSGPMIPQPFIFPQCATEKRCCECISKLQGFLCGKRGPCEFRQPSVLGYVFIDPLTPVLQIQNTWKWVSREPRLGDLMFVCWFSEMVAH